MLFNTKVDLYPEKVIASFLSGVSFPSFRIILLRDVLCDGNQHIFMEHYRVVL